MQIAGYCSDTEKISLLALPQRRKARIVSFRLPPERCARLLEMGLTTGTQIQLIRFAPLGDPVEIEVRGYRLSLRKSDAKDILVTCKEGSDAAK